MKTFVAILLSLASFNLLSAEFDPFEGPKPIAVFVQTDPWAMVMGSDTPRVAVYEDGTVIFLKESGKGVNYRRKGLSATELADFKKRWAPTAGLKDLKHVYSLLPNVTDQPEALFYFRDGERELTTRVYGLKAAGTKLPAYTVFSDTQKPDAVPKELIELHKFLCGVEYPRSKEWTPRYLEVMVWPFDYASDPPISWPKDWPGLESKRSSKRGDSYSIFLDGSTLPDPQKFLRRLKEKDAVEIGGRKWAVSFRPVFPSEPVWRRALEKTQEK